MCTSDKTGGQHAMACHVMSDQINQNQQDRGSARLLAHRNTVVTTITKSLGCLSDSNASHSIPDWQACPDQHLRGSTGGDTVTQAQDTRHRPAKPIPCPRPHPSHPYPWIPCSSFCYTYFYFVHIIVPRLLASSPFSSGSCGRRLNRADTDRAVILPRHLDTLPQVA